MQATVCIGARDCPAVVFICRKALKMFRGNKSRTNAVRHFVWRVALCVVFGLRCAKIIDAAHGWDLEWFGGAVARDSRRDKANHRTSMSTRLGQEGAQVVEC